MSKSVGFIMDEGKIGKLIARRRRMLLAEENRLTRQLECPQSYDDAMEIADRLQEIAVELSKLPR